MKSMYQNEPKEQDGRRNSPRAQEAMKHSAKAELRIHHYAGNNLTCGLSDAETFGLEQITDYP